MARAGGLAYSRPMSDAPDLDALAKRFLDLWQAQVAASVSDPALADWIAQLMAGAPGAPDALNAAPRGQAHAGIAAFTAAAGGAPAAAAAPGAGDERLVELDRRLAACEERLAALERAAGEAGGGARAKPRKRKG